LQRRQRWQKSPNVWQNAYPWAGQNCCGGGTSFTGRRQVNEILTTKPEATICIGRNCNLNGAIIGAAKSITIRDNCIIAEAYIRDTSSHGIAPDKRRDPGAAVVAPVVIQENVWVGSQVHVMPGVTIGKNSIIGVNSVVTRSIPENVFAAGNPARVIKTLS
jgi:acetyltransferase-like isoleucine patch superfamily enzyme